MARVDTIAAVATAAGRAGIGIVRVSGPQASAIGRAITGKDLAPRQATLSEFRAADASTIDRGIALIFPAPHSYTGEDILELQGHGGTIVLQLLLQRCLELGSRPAQPGEFTRRAFLNDKLDLAQAEAVADLIDASSVAAARGAMRSLRGEFSREVHTARDELIELRAQIEAVLDFPEEDVELLERSDVTGKLLALRSRLEQLGRSSAQGALLREGIRAVLLGRPNVGKSSLMNRLAQEEVAIVTEIPGTTRDALLREVAIEGVPFHMVDTAGLRATSDPVERLGVERSWQQIQTADLLLEIRDVTEPADAAGDMPSILPGDSVKITVFNKIDLAALQPKAERQGDRIRVWLSAKTGDGIDTLKQAMLESIGWRGLEEAPFMARQRHLTALARAAAAVGSAQKLLGSPDLMAEELRIAQFALSEITGEFSADDLLGEIFSRFCIGK
jgi:tRNA modification GTPase